MVSLSELPDLFDEWVEFRRYSIGTEVTYRKALKLFFDYLKSHEINDPKLEHVQAFRDESKKKKAESTVNVYVTGICGFFEWLDRYGYYPNITEGLTRKTKPEHRKTKADITDKDVQKILDGIDRTTKAGLRDYAMALLLTTTDLTLVDLAIADVIDFGHFSDGSPTIRLNRVMKYGRYKGDPWRPSQQIPDEAGKAIQEYLETRGECKGTDPLFKSVGNRSKGRMRPESIGRIIKEHCHNAGFSTNVITAKAVKEALIPKVLVIDSDLDEAAKVLSEAGIKAELVAVQDLKRSKNPQTVIIANAIKK